MNEQSPIKTDVKTVLAIIAAVAAGVWAWSGVKSEISSHTEQLQAIQSTVRADHDAIMIQSTLVQQQGFILEKMDKKIDFLTGATRVRPTSGGPASSP